MSSRVQADLSRRQFIGAWGSLLAMATPVAGPQSTSAASLHASRRPKLGDLTVNSLEAAERVFGLNLRPEDRVQALKGVARQREQFMDRRRGGYLANSEAPANCFDPLLPGQELREQQNRVRLSASTIPTLPTEDEAIAFAPVSHLSTWIRKQQLSSERLTQIYLDRLRRYDPLLHCLVTLLPEKALEQARSADKEIAAGRYRGPLHGIPWGAKDLFDTRGDLTTWGATPYRGRVAERDAFVVRKLESAGAVLLAKLTLGALAMGDVWFDDVTRNPFNPAQGSSGSSAGSASATAAGLVGFSLGTETLGSIVSPCMRCGATGLRPTFGRVARSGAMALCWSLDKIGPICRTVEDTALVLAAINGADHGDPSSVDHGFEFDGRQDIRGLRLGYSPRWFEGDGMEIERGVLERAKELGLELVTVETLDEKINQLYTILNVEASAAFEELTLEGLDATLVGQGDGAWPNIFRRSWMIPAVEFVQADRYRRRVMTQMAALMKDVDVLLSPSYAGRLLVATNFTGHPSLTLRAGFKADGTPTGITLWGGLFEEGKLCLLGSALERALGVWRKQPLLDTVD